MDKIHNLLPNEGSKKVGAKIMEIVEEVIDDKKELGLHDTWQRSYELRMGKHWRSSPSRKVPLVTANLIYMHTQRVANTLTDNNPIFNISKYGRVDDSVKGYLEDMQHTIDYWWNEREQQEVFARSIINGEQYGCAIEKVIFNPSLEYGIGDVETINVDPFHFGWYPVKLSDPRDIQKCQAVFHYYPIPLSEAKQRWPEFAEEIKADEDIFKELNDDRRELNVGSNNATSGYNTTIGGSHYRIFNFLRGGGETPKDEVLVIECWSKDYTEETIEDEIQEIDPMTGEVMIQKISITQPKYKGNIRYTVTLNGGKLVVEDRSNPNVSDMLSDEEARKTYLYDKYPFVMVNSVTDTSSAWGLSDYSQLEQLNVELNKSISQLVLTKDRMARAKVINPKTTGVQNHEFTNINGIINPTNSSEASSIRYLENPPMQLDLTSAVELFKTYFYLVAGTFEIDQAQGMNKNRLAYKSISALLELAATMNRGKIRNYYRLIRERGRMFISMVQNFYNEERYISYVNDRGMLEAKNVNLSGMVIPTKLAVVVGSTMPISKVQQREEALELYRIGAIDREELLSRLDWGNRNEILSRMNMGVYGQLFQKLQSVGMPEEMIAYLDAISKTEDDKIEKAMQKGQIPNFQDVLSDLVSGIQQQEQGGSIEQQSTILDLESKKADIQNKMAQAQKLEAEKMLTLEKIATEKVEQWVKQHGVALDQEQIKIEKSKIMAELQRNIAMSRKEKIVSAQRNRPGFNEKGMESNNIKKE